ncbi:major facilitator superfamily domain-containing protein [Myxozyma melibiosi]|uniref:Probable transporter MCH1 n=1 Tax=Myxozyma melibiosi TaxID=54550 RepID=A0ABR1F9X9_9ASCO
MPRRAEPLLRPEEDPLAAAAEADAAVADFLEPPPAAKALPQPSEPVANRDIDDSALKPDRATRYRQILTFASALLCCICGGSIMLFSLYAPQFQTHLGYTQVQVNVLSILGEVGMYLTTPIVGITADIYGSGFLAVLAAIFFAFAYGLAAWAYASLLPYPVMMVSFLFIGGGTACIYFGSITACAKTFSSNRGLALGLPITAYGLSSLWQSQIVAHFFTDKTTGEVYVPQLFIFFALFLASVGLVAAFGYRNGCKLDSPVPLSSGSRKSSVSFRKTTDEETPLLDERDSMDSDVISMHPTSQREIDDDSSSTMSDDIDMIPEAHVLTRKQMVVEFVQDITAWGLALGLFATTGPGEMFLNNMGSIIRSLSTPGPSASTNVAIISFFSSAMRIVAGVASDQIATRGPKYSRMWVLLFFTVVLAFGHWFVALGGLEVNNGEYFWLVSATLGAGYGAVFTLAPTLVSLVWGAERFGTNWGVLFVFPAVGSIIYELIYAGIYDHNTVDSKLCFGLQCYQTTFFITGISVLLALVAFTSVWLLGWRRRSSVFI